jgi:hypothetical protein
MPTVMLSTTASSSVGPSTPTNYRVGPIDLLSPGTWIGAAILAILALGSVVRVPRRLRGYALLVLLLLLTTIGVVACGGGGASGEDGGGSTGTTTGVYVVNISGTSGSTTATPISVYFNLE